MTTKRRLHLISSRGHCQRFLPSQTSYMPQAGFEPAQNLDSDFVQWSCAVATAAKPRRHKIIIVP